MTMHTQVHDVAEEIQNLGPWFHNLHLPRGLQTAPHHVLGDFPAFKWEQLAPSLPDRMDGWTVLDVGCNAGFYTFQLAGRGAQVTGIDVDPRYLRQAEWAASQFGLSHRVQFRRMQIYDLAGEAKQYDMVLFMGVFYHLRYPLLALDIVARVVRHLLVFQSMTAPGDEVCETPADLALDQRELLLNSGWPRLAFIEHRVMGDPTNWWVPNHAAVLALMRASGFRVLSRPAPETYLCVPDPSNPSAVETWDIEQFRSAAGRRFPSREG
jgi:tRNA (mo5U34)-methyltransferase